MYRQIDTWMVDTAISVERGFMLRAVSGTEVLIQPKKVLGVCNEVASLDEGTVRIVDWLVLC